MSDFDPFDVFEEIGPDGIDVGDGVVIKGEQRTITTDDNSINVNVQQASITDTESGASVKLNEGELQASASEHGVSAHVRETSFNVDSGTSLGPVKISGHLFEAEGYGSARDDKVGLGGHLDIAGADIQIGDQGTHIKGGVSYGEGLGVEFATGEDSDGDGYGEWGMKGEGGPYSGDVRFEPGAVYDGAVKEGEEILTDAADAGVQARQIADDFAEDPEGMVQQWSDDADRATDDAWNQVSSTADELLETGQRAIDNGALDPSAPYRDAPSLEDVENYGSGLVDDAESYAGDLIDAGQRAIDDGALSPNLPSDGVTLEGAQSAWDTVTSTADELIDAGQAAIDDGALSPNLPSDGVTLEGAESAWDTVTSSTDDLIETGQAAIDNGALNPATPYAAPVEQAQGYADDLIDTVQTGLDGGALDPGTPYAAPVEQAQSYADDLVETVQTGFDGGAVDPGTPYEAPVEQAQSYVDSVVDYASDSFEATEDW